MMMREGEGKRKKRKEIGVGKEEEEEREREREGKGKREVSTAAQPLGRDATGRDDDDFRRWLWRCSFD